MKRTYFLLAVVVFLATSASAQALLKVNPGGLLLGTGSGSLEWFFSPLFSIQADGLWIPGVERYDTQFTGAGAGVSVRLYAGAMNRPTGFFLSPFVAMHWMAFDDFRSVSYRYNYTALGGQIGYQRTWKQILTLEAGVGVWTGLNVPVFKQAVGVTSYFGEGANVWLNIGVGVMIWKK